VPTPDRDGSRSSPTSEEQPPRAGELGDEEELRVRDEEALRQVDEGLRELAGVLTAQLPAVVSSSALAAALTVVLRAQGERVRLPRLSASAEAWNDNPVAALAELARLRYRRVQLIGPWWRQDAGPLLAFRRTGEGVHPVALLPTRRGYDLVDPDEPAPRLVDAALHAELLDEAVSFFRPLPEGNPGFVGLVAWAARPHLRSLFLAGSLLFAMTLLGMLVPIATGWIVDVLIPDADWPVLVQLCVVLIAVAVGQMLLLLAQTLIAVRVQTRLTLDVQAAVWDRLLRLGTAFFRRFSSGELLQRAMLVTEISHAVNGIVVQTLFTGLLALLNFALLVYYAPGLAMTALVVALAGSSISAVLSLVIRRRALRLVQIEGRLLGFVVGLIRGITRLRTAGGERRAFGQWANRFAGQVRLENTIQLLEDINRLVTTLLTGVATLVLFAATGAALRAAPGSFSPGQFVAFFAAFGLFMAGVSSLAQTVVEVIDSLARQRLLQPILDEPLEATGHRVDPGRLAGYVAVEAVTFRYRPESPVVLDRVSLEAQPGEFIAIVGPSGSGKSTLLRLLVGFEQPEAGRISYDGRDLQTLNLLAVRRQLGVVLQSAYLLAGSIFDNIAAGHVVTAEEVWQAARDAAFAEDIEQMPMKLNTLVSEQGTNLSGGQRQRLLLARALVRRPRILLLDEATSALDNPTQERVTLALRERKVTRIVVAHRLSTIAAADRIYVLDRGRVVQCGRFADLVQVDGLFRRLAERQRPA
jgi:NHLM bacteriocin system ABC transporter ATP-binding protein